MSAIAPTASWLQARGVARRFGDTQALRGVTLEVAAGEVVALLGGNGAGKTTLIELCVGFDTPDAGEIRVSSIDPARDALRARARNAYLPETIALFDDLTARQTLHYFRALNGLPGLTDEAVDGALVAAGLAREAIGRPVRGYSKGMRQKLALAISLGRPLDGLLLDEPTTGLDAGAVTELAAMLRRVADEGVAVLFATHDFGFARAIADRAIVLQAGLVRGEIARSAFATEGLAAFYAASLEAR